MSSEPRVSDAELEQILREAKHGTMEEAFGAPPTPEAVENMIADLRNARARIADLERERDEARKALHPVKLGMWPGVWSECIEMAAVLQMPAEALLYARMSEMVEKAEAERDALAGQVAALRRELEFEHDNSVCGGPGKCTGCEVLASTESVAREWRERTLAPYLEALKDVDEWSQEAARQMTAMTGMMTSIALPLSFVKVLADVRAGAPMDSETPGKEEA